LRTRDDPEFDPKAVFDEAVRQYPRRFELYQIAIFRLTPQWGGSWKSVEGTARAWSRQLEGTEG